MSLARACLSDAEGQGAEAAALKASFARNEPTRLLALAPSHWPTIVRIAPSGVDRSLGRAVSGALRSLTVQNETRRSIRAVRAHVDGPVHWRSP
ncbi:hypothetical protein [Streptomyces sp. NPDC054804]